MVLRGISSSSGGGGGRGATGGSGSCIAGGIGGSCFVALGNGGGGDAGGTGDVGIGFVCVSVASSEKGAPLLTSLRATFKKLIAVRFSLFNMSGVCVSLARVMISSSGI